MLQELAKRKAQNPLRYLKPHPKQEKFLLSTKRINLFLGANRSGKTVAGLIKALEHTFGYRFWQVPDLQLVKGPRGRVDLPPRESIPTEYWIRRSDGLPIAVPNRGLILTGLPARRGLGEAIWPTVQAFIPPELKPKISWLLPGCPATITWPNGSVWSFGSGEASELSTESFAIDWTWLDEPVPKKFWTGVWRGLTQSFGPAWFTLTPLGTKGAWLYHHFIAPKVREDRKDDNDSVAFFEIVMRDNPHLTEDMIEGFESDPTMSEQEKQARCYGKFEFLANRIYPMFIPSHPYTCKPFAIPPEWPRAHVVDPHTGRPYAMIWAAQSPSNVWYVYREWPEEDYTKLTGTDKGVKDYALLYHQIEGPYRPRWRIMDPNFGRQHRLNTRGIQERSLEELFSDYSIFFDTRVDDDLDRGHEAVRNALRYNQHMALAPDNHPRVVVFDNCHNTIAAMTNYGFKETSDPNVRSEKVSEEWKDFADLIRYLVVYDFPYRGEAYSYFEREPERGHEGYTPDYDDEEYY